MPVIFINLYFSKNGSPGVPVFFLFSGIFCSYKITKTGRETKLFCH